MNLEELLGSAGRKLREDFAEIQECNPHSGEKGSEAEDILRQFLRERLPRRFDVAAGIVLGADGSVSRQSDVLIYDAINSPVYRTGTRLQILPRDNVPAVIEVKSKLNKDELRDAAQKIASVKAIKASPISGADQPVTFSDLITTSVLGCVFAFDSYTTLETLADNLKEINQAHEPEQWIDLVVVLDKGCIGYQLQNLFQEFIGWVGGTEGDKFPVPPLYVQLVHTNLGERALYQFFVRLMSHLMFFRKLSAVDLATFESALGGQAQTIQGYQDNLSRRLVPVESAHQGATFELPKVRFNLYGASTKKYIGQVCFLPWQDGATLIFSTLVDPGLLFSAFLSQLKLKGQLFPAKTGARAWTSTVLPISEEQFIEIATAIRPDVISVRDGDGDGLPPLTIP